MRIQNIQFAITGALAALSLAAFVGSAQAQNNIPNGQFARASKVYGNEVISSDNQKVGKLNNMVIDLQSGRILYGVIGTGNGRVAVAPEIFTSTKPVNGQLHVNVDKAKLDGAPKFNRSVDTPTGWGQASFVDQVYAYFGQSAWWQGSTPANQGTFKDVHKASKVISMNVENVNNQPVGEIKNVIVDLPAGRIAYLMLQPNSSLNLGNNLYALPPQAFTLSPNGNKLVSNIDQQKLSGAPHFASNNWQNLSNPSFASQVYQYYGKQPWFQTSGGTIQPTGR